MALRVAPSFEQLERLSGTRDADLVGRRLLDPATNRGRGAQSNRGSRFDREPRRSFGDGEAPRTEGRPASPWAGRSEARGDSRFEGRREFGDRPRHPEHRTEFPHVAKRSSTHHTAGNGRSEGTGGKPRAGRTFNRDR